ncbi:conserved hypothetical protein [Verticillium alfalfae VaMs.102]|uniref:ubiquitinyl hydrolase 1 n=1 Tax=Verticillium alfalfae (strain VaMs.102 / ATCC MYA-4576 / FGSC 10136) TaxID=526221 RepID=C9SRI6_VERA1|nr:conserved hypothetical protein [Verticillium alfalfae VaMs.102]EEY21401.1 conserved hypothetical protein [Verticillium alfalfae VaMs.102]
MSLQPSSEGGRTAPRWIYDLLSGLIHEVENSVKLSVDERLAYLQPELFSHSHDFKVFPEQSNIEGANPTILSLLCRGCDHHIVVKVVYDESRAQGLCNAGVAHYTGSLDCPPEAEDLAHHLVHESTWSSKECEQLADPHRSPLVGRTQYKCSGASCSLQVTVETYLPRLNLEWLKALQDMNVSFGEELWPLFNALGFVEQTLDNDGADEDYFVPEPLEPPNPPTQIGTLRSFVEDMRFEVENRIIALGQQGPASPHHDSAVDRLEKALHCFNWPQNKSFHVQSINPRDAEFSLLGVLPNFDKSLTLFAYYRQCLIWPANRKLLTDALANNAKRLGDDELMLQATVEESKIDHPGAAVIANGDNDDTAMIWQAASFFGLDNIQAVGDHVIVSKFKEKVQNDPGQEGLAKEFLLVLGRSRKSDRLIEAAQGPMSLNTAFVWLEANEQYDDEFIETMASTKIKSHPGNQYIKDECLEALDTISRNRKSDRLAAFAQELMLSQDDQLTAAQALVVRYDLPVGLKNIGNTCYLNSILQYLYTVKPVRDLVLNFDDHKLDLSDESIAARRIGSNRMPLTRPDAVVSFACAEELWKLFNSLYPSDQVAVKPAQRLANAALFLVQEVAEGASKDQGSSQSKSLPDVMGNIDIVIVSVDAVSDAASTGSSKTLIGDAMEIDVNSDKVGGPLEGEVLPSIEGDAGHLQSNQDTAVAVADSDDPMNDARVLAALETQKRSSGTEQQDVGEVLGRLLDRVQGAIKHTRVTEDGMQLDLIMDIFYISIKTRNQKDGQEPQVQVTFDRYVSAFPSQSGPCDINDALSRNFDLEYVEDSGYTRYSGIDCSVKPPTILQVMIQRTSSNGTKNGNPVIVSEDLYLDRFVDAVPGSRLYEYRSASWTLQKRILQLGELPAAPKVDNSDLLGHFIRRGLDTPPTETLSDAPEEPGRVVKHALLSPPSPPKLAKKLRQVRSHCTTEHRFRCTAVDHRTFLSWVYHISQGLLFDRIDAVEHNLLILKALSLRRRPGLIGSGALFRHHWHLLFRTRAEMAYWVAYTVMQAADQTLSRQLYQPFQR